MSNVQEAEYDGKDECVDGMIFRLGGIAVDDEGELKMFVPEEAVVGTEPEGCTWTGEVGSVTEEGVGQIVGIWKVEWIDVEVTGD
jgi:hypothetical protein